MGRWGMSLFISCSGDLTQLARSRRDGRAYTATRQPSAGQVENGIRSFRGHAPWFHASRFGTAIAQYRRRSFACTLLVDEIFQRDGVEILDHLLIERGPEFVGHAVAVMLLGAFASTLSTTLRGVDRLVHRNDDVRHRNVLGTARKIVSTARTAHRLDDLVPAQLAEQLFEIGQRDVL